MLEWLPAADGSGITGKVGALGTLQVIWSSSRDPPGYVVTVFGHALVTLSFDEEAAKQRAEYTALLWAARAVDRLTRAENTHSASLDSPEADAPSPTPSPTTRQLPTTPS
jgi:hypothetical protein